MSISQQQVHTVQITKRVKEWSVASLQVATPESIERDQQNRRIGTEILITAMFYNNTAFKLYSLYNNWLT